MKLFLILGILLTLSQCSTKSKDNKTQNLALAALVLSQPKEYVGQGKLVFTEGNTLVKVYDLQNGKLEKTFTFEDKGTAIRVYAGGSHLFAAVALGQGLNATSEIRYIDVGIQSSNSTEAKLLDGKVEGERFASHYRADGIYHLKFFDNQGKTVISTEASLRNGVIDKLEHTQEPHHGVALGLDEQHILISRKNPNLSFPLPSGQTGNSVAYGVSIWKKEGSNFTKIQDSPNCENMHGEANNAEYTAFGCRLSGVNQDTIRVRDEGILVVKKTGTQFAFHKVKYPTGSEADRVTSNIWAHKNQKKMIGNFNKGTSRKILLFDPSDVNSAQQIDVEDYSSVVYEWAKGNEIVLLHASGKLGVYNSSTMQKIRDLETGLTSNSNVAMASGIGRVYLTLKTQGKILEVPLDGSQVKTIDVGGAPENIVYLNTVASANVLAKSMGMNLGAVGWTDTYDPWSDLNE